MKRKFIWNLLLVVVLNILIKPFYILGIDAEVINRVGASVYGNYFALINFLGTPLSKSKILLDIRSKGNKNLVR